MIKIAGGVTAPHGYSAIGAHVGLKRKRKDLALIVSDVPATVTAVFTTNTVKAAPVLWNQDVVNGSNQVKAIVVNSGQANSCTGKVGFEHCQIMARTTADVLDCQPQQVMVASTGLIGVPIPIEKATAGIKLLAGQLGRDADAATLAAEAIMTTDSFSKEIAVQINVLGIPIKIGGMAKGSGMVHPNMATMLAFLTTDALITPALLQKAMRDSTCTTYNMISVDGDTSTNDMAIMLANGLAGNALIDDPNSDEYKIFCQAVHSVNTFLAKAIARDGEGATKFLEVSIQGTQTLEDAQKLARSVVSSSLVKTALFGQDANWGRIIAALGRGGVMFDPQGICIQFASDAGEVSLMQQGKPLHFDADKASKILSEKNIRISIDLSEGESAATAWGCDLSYDYVRINGSYRC